MFKRFLLLFCIIIIRIESKTVIKILVVVNQFPCVSQQFILELIKELINRGHCINVHSFKQGDNSIIESDIKLYHLDSCMTYGKVLPSLDSFDIIAVQFGNLAKKVINQAEVQNYKGKIIVSFRGHDLSKFLQKNPYYYDDDLFSKIDLCLPVCLFFKERLIKLGCPPEKIFVHYSGLNFDAFPIKSAQHKTKEIFKIVTIARLVEKKGIEYVLRAISLLKKRYSSIHYYIFGDEVGNSGEKARLNKLAHDLRINSCVDFCGWKSHNEIIQQLLSANLMVLPSITSRDGDEEGIPNAVKEAMAVGLPVITTQRVGSELIQDGKSGFLVQEKNYKQLASKMAYCIQNQIKSKSLGQKARQVIQQFFDIKKTTALLEKQLYLLLHCS